jgi:peptidoglycan/LPS O-acetylase OafA/YrhL
LLGHLAWSLPLLGVVLSYYGDALDVGARVVGSFWLITTGYTALLLFATQAKGTWLHRLLTMSALRWIGIRCYALYLFHQAVMGLMGGYFAGRSDFLVEDAWSFSVWLGAILATLALAALSWRFVERPMIAFGHRWTYQRRRAAATMPETQPITTEAPTRHAA